MRSLCFSPEAPPLRRPVTQHSLALLCRNNRRTLSEVTVEQTIDAAATIFAKWDVERPSYARSTTLFYESKTEAVNFIRSVNDLHKIMRFLLNDRGSGSEKLSQVQRLLQIAMKRLQKEFYQILSMNRAHLDPESVSSRSSRTSTKSSFSDYDFNFSPDNEIRAAGDSISEVQEVSFMAMSDLKLIADCMIACGYAKECVQIYNSIRKSIIDEGIYKLGIEKLRFSQIKKIEWDVLNLKIKDWLEAIEISMRSLFPGERILCDFVFSSSDSIRESCFSEITKEGAIALFGFPELVAKAKKWPPEKSFRLLAMYTAISGNRKEIETIFSFESSSAVRSQALKSLTRLSESVRSLLSDFESTIRKDSSKAMVPGGDFHPLTIYSMKYLASFAEYSNILADIIFDWSPPAKSPPRESYFYSPIPVASPASAISARISWLMFVLLCKLDSKAKCYKDAAVSYLFLANNIQHVISVVHESNLHCLLGEEWIVKQEAKVNRLVDNYERLAFGNVFASLPKNPTAPMTPAEAKQCFRKFNISFEAAYLKQISCVIPDSKLRDQIKASIGRKLVAVY
ncbi:UDP-glucuronic acid decarboxylase 1-like [Hibiscus syriacus]|uniref:Exocyst subunit Exo70 family protein n=1 Tax=Hibiscus syriacus TaxID=106335 RepID=A0A6A2X5G9_HIBSY|nr:UDP-glucuronic acid decarboxylase 1-like [Hibiscus syriacus]